jgi:uncharacterized protein YheU (UPF0270 family)
MKQQTFAEMSAVEFDALIDSYIAREATGYGEMPVEVFLDLLLERAEAQVEETINLAVSLKGDHLVITPDREVNDVAISGNEILIGSRRLVLEMARPG